jgi:hypothetical protein
LVQAGLPVYAVLEPGRGGGRPREDQRRRLGEQAAGIGLSERRRTAVTAAAGREQAAGIGWPEQRQTAGMAAAGIGRPAT